MKIRKAFDCVEMKRRGAEEAQRILVGMTQAEELDYWQAGTDELRHEQEKLRAGGKSAARPLSTSQKS